MKEQEKQISPLRKWGALLVLSLALAIIIIDGTVLNVSISTLIKDLNTDIKSFQWVVTSYSLVLAALTITGGRLGDLFGRKKMFILGSIIFAIGSFISSVSKDVTTLLIGWSLVEGIGAALMMPATSSLLVSNYKGRERAIAFGVWGGVAAAASAVGPIIGGYLTTNVSWHWAFRINVFIVVFLLGTSFLVKESKDKNKKLGLDFLGIILSTLGLSSFVYGIIESTTYGWIKAKQPYEIFDHIYKLGGISIVPFALITGIVFIILFVLWQLKRESAEKTPLVSMKIFLNHQFRSGIVTTLILVLSQTGLIFTLPVFLQTVKGLDAFHTGLALLPLSITVLFVAPISAVISKKVTPKRLIQLGIITIFLAVLVLYVSITIDASILKLTPGMILFGIGLGLVMAQISNISLSAVDVKLIGEASGVTGTARHLGSVLGSALIGSIFISGFVTYFKKDINDNKYLPDTVKVAITENISQKSSEFQFGGGFEMNGSLSPAIANEIVTTSHEATVSANKQALILTSLFTLLSLVMSTRLPNIKNLERNSEVTSV